MQAVIDTNILIDYLIGLAEAKDTIKAYENPIISRITWMELLVGAETDEQEVIRQFLNSFMISEITADICELAINIRREYRIRLPDAIIWATAKFHNALLITRDSKDFPGQAADIKIPYIIH